MTPAILSKLLAMTLTVALGYLAKRRNWLGRPQDGDAARLLSNAAFTLFVPALLFRTTARLDLAHLPWRTLAAFFVPALLVLLGVYAARRRGRVGGAAAVAVAAPSVLAIASTFGNSVQMGIPFAAALFGEAGLAVHIPLVSLHALVLLSVLTALVELDLARALARTQHGAAVPLARTLALTVRNTVVHPVVLPVLAGLTFNLSGLPLPAVADEMLATLAAAVVPVCLVLIGATLATYGLHGRVRGALAIVGVKLLALPALVLLVAHWGFGLVGVPLAVVVMMAAMPIGSNALIFAQRYDALQGEVTAAIVISTIAFALTGSLWLALLAWLGV